MSQVPGFCRPVPQTCENQKLGNDTCLTDEKASSHRVNLLQCKVQLKVIWTEPKCMSFPKYYKVSMTDCLNITCLPATVIEKQKK